MGKSSLIEKISVKILLFVLIALLVSNRLQAGEKKTVTFKADDGLVITADLYAPHPNEAAFIILFHQARSSRGEYIEIAPELNKLGFNCLAVDQRSGGKMNKIVNLTNRQAIKLGKPTDYLDALPDMQAAIRYIKSHYKKAKLIIWGSSYSASLVIKLAGDNAELVDGVLAFSPGEYFIKKKISIKDSAANVKCPVFITSALREANMWEAIFRAIPSKSKYSFLPKTRGNHGSGALWKRFADSGDYWQAVTDFLQKYFSQKKNTDDNRV